MTNERDTVQALVDALEDITNCGAEAWGEHRNCNKQARAALTEGRALIAQMQRDAVQPGWKLVPVEPTDEMQAPSYMGPDGPNWPIRKEIYRAMVAAAPHPEAQALDSPRSVTAQEDRVLRKAALRSSTLVARGKLGDSQQQDDHAGSPAPSEPMNIHLLWRAACEEWGNAVGGPDEYEIFAEKLLACRPAPSEPVWIQPDHLAKARLAPFLCRVEPQKRNDFVPLYAAPSAQSSKAALSDEEIKAAAKQAGFLFHTIPEYAPIQHTLPEEFSERCFYRFARAILARAGITRKPLTEEEIMDICKETSMLMWDEVDGYSIRGFARAIEAAHGITPQAGKESGE